MIYLCDSISEDIPNLRYDSKTPYVLRAFKETKVCQICFLIFQIFREWKEKAKLKDNNTMTALIFLVS